MPPSILILFGFAAALIVAGGTAALWHGLFHPKRKTYGVVLAAGLATDPAELDWAAQEGTLTMSDGATTPAWFVEGRRRFGPVVVIVHGFGDSRYGAMACWAPRVMPFASTIVLYDQRGQGESAAKSGGLGVREVDDLAGLLDQIPGGAPVVLYGYSLGAGVAIAAGARRGDRVVGVIADSPYRHWHEPVRRLLRRDHYPTQPFMFLTSAILRLTVPGFARFDRAALAEKLHCPLLVLHGTEDELCPIESAQAIAQLAPQGTLVTFEGGTHLKLAELDAQRYNAAVEQFFGKLSQT